MLKVDVKKFPVLFKDTLAGAILDIGANETFYSTRLVASLSRVIWIIKLMPIIKRGYSVSITPVYFPRRGGANIII